MGLAEVEGVDPPEPIVVIVPREKYEILEDWGDLIGLKGSGSNSVVIDNAFVPAHHTAPIARLMGESPMTTEMLPGGGIHGNPMTRRLHGFRDRRVGFGGSATGQGMLDEYERLISSKKTTFSPHVLRARHHDYQRTLGQTMGMVDAAEATIVRVGQLYMQYCADAAAGERPFTIEMDYRLDQMAIQAGFLAYDAAGQLVRTAGSSPMANGARMQRYLRDLVQYRTHQAASAWEAMATTTAQQHLGPILD